MKGGRFSVCRLDLPLLGQAGLVLAFERDEDVVVRVADPREEFVERYDIAVGHRYEGAASAGSQVFHDFRLLVRAGSSHDPDFATEGDDHVDAVVVLPVSELLGAHIGPDEVLICRGVMVIAPQASHVYESGLGQNGAFLVAGAGSREGDQVLVLHEHAGTPLLVYMHP